MQLPILVIADQDRSFHVVCDASDFAIGCALMQYYTDSADNPMHDKELLAINYALAKLRVYLLVDRPFVV